MERPILSNTAFRFLGGKTAGEAFASNKILSNTAFRFLGGKTAASLRFTIFVFIGCKRFASFYDFCFYWMQTLRLRLHPIKSSLLLRILLDANASPAVFPPSNRKAVVLRILLDANASPAVFPPSNRKIDLRKSKEQMKKYRNPRRRMILTKNKASRLTFPKPPNSVNVQNSRSPLCRTMIKRRNLNNQIKRQSIIKYGANMVQILPEQLGPRSWCSGKAQGSNSSLFSPSCSSSQIPASKYASLCFNVRKTKITVLQSANSREKKF